MDEKTVKRKVVIIGAGVSGLATGIYLLKSGYDVSIYEKNAIPGGACVGWDRKGNYIDGCIHWLVGTNTASGFNKIWREVHALNADTEIFFQENFSVFDFPDGSHLTVWADVDKFEKELIEFSPADEKEIKKFIKVLRRFLKIEAPINKPADMMNIFELLKVGVTMGGDYYWFLKTSKIGCAEQAERFKDERLRYLFREFMPARYNMMSMFYMLSHVMHKNGGIPVGGSRAMSNRMYKYYLDLGGEMHLSSPVEKILTENGVAKGVQLKSGEEVFADWTVSTTAVEHCLKDLLDGEIKVKKIDERLADSTTYPIYTMTSVVFKSSDDMKKYPLGLHTVFASSVKLDKEYDNFSIRSYNYDKTTMPEDGKPVVQAQIFGDDSMYFWWNERKCNGSYASEKMRIAEEIKQMIYARYPELEGKFEVIDVFTPCTFERYLNTRHGTFQGFVHTKAGKMLMQKGTLKNLKKFVLSGQWIFQSGGLPPAVLTGRFSAQRICKADKVLFRASDSNIIDEVKKLLAKKQKV